MASDREEFELQDIAELKGGFAFKSEDYTDSGIFVLRTVNITESGRITRNGATFVSEEMAKEFDRFALRHHDTLFVMVGATLGKVGLVKHSDLPALLNQNMWVIRANESKVNPLYLHYAFSEESKSVLGWASGAARDFARRDDYRKLNIRLPPRKTQDRISNIIGSIDEKIEINRLFGQTLEAMAQAIFKSWFVDFDPVKAKIAALQEGRDPLRAAMSAINGKSDDELDTLPSEQYDILAGLAALFPDEMWHTDQGNMPIGWSMRPISSLCKLNPSSWSAKTLPETVRYVDLANAKHGEIVDVKELRGGDIPSRARRVLEKGDTVVGTVRPGNRSFALVGQAGLTGSTGFAVLHPTHSYLREYVYLAATSDDNIERLSRLADGGAYPAVRPEVVVEHEVPVANHQIFEAFHAQVAPLFGRVQHGREESRTLADLRDTLLPKLLSGEIVPESIS